MYEKLRYVVDGISKKIQQGQNVEFNWNKYRTSYRIFCMAPNVERSINIPSIIIVPQSDTISNQIVLEVNNCDTSDLSEMLINGATIGEHLIDITRENYAPMVIPLLPAMNENSIYFQQLSKECFELPDTDIYYRIDEQVIRIINEAKTILEGKFGIKSSDKIFLNGYSSSAIFAQRFSLIHPEMIEAACIGGAIGSIPVPSRGIGYPIGIEDFEKLFGKKFNIDSYSKIKFKYYVGELETAMKADNRVDDDGMPAPMHDMSYFDKSVPTEIGKEQRNVLGKDMFARANKTIEILKKQGIDIELTIIPGRSHNDRSGTGVNEFTVKIPFELHRDMCNDNMIMKRDYQSQGQER